MTTRSLTLSGGSSGTMTLATWREGAQVRPGIDGAPDEELPAIDGSGNRLIAVVCGCEGGLYFYYTTDNDNAAAHAALGLVAQFGPPQP